MMKCVGKVQPVTVGGEGRFDRQAVLDGDLRRRQQVLQHVEGIEPAQINLPAAPRGGLA